MPLLSVYLIDQIESKPTILKRFVQLLDMDFKSFFQKTLQHILPFLVLEERTEVLHELARWLDCDLAQMLIEEGGHILSHLLLQDKKDTDQALSQFVKIASLDFGKVSAGQLFRSCLLMLTTNLVVGLGSDDLSKSQKV